MYVKFTTLLAERKLPLSNIAYLLFVGVVDWFSLDSTRDMRYVDDVKRFWRIELILFKGKFLRSLFYPESLLINNDIILGTQAIHNIYDIICVMNRLRTEDAMTLTLYDRRKTVL